MGVLFKVQNELGPSLLEKYYQRGISKELKRSGLKFKKEVLVEIRYENESIGKYFLDFVIEDLVILEVKAQRYYTPRFFKQTLAYLKQTDLPLAIIVNFRGDKLRYKRVINPAFRDVDLTNKDLKFESIR
jgi:GxxExxY protein